LDGPDPECVSGHGEPALAAAAAVPVQLKPRPSQDHTKPSRTPVGV
ncbi:MAG TPA: mycofactocin radical SAM maturase, partial [Acidimicrobiaceae bacterium]|nr:mycofactocin radical SAM maturase [Acidimicrobiaceae bacterium]